MATPTKILDHVKRAFNLLPAQISRRTFATIPNWKRVLRGLLGPEDDGPYAVASSDTTTRRVTINGDVSHRFRAGATATIAASAGGAADGQYGVVSSSYDSASDQTNVFLAESFAALGGAATIAGRATHSVQELESVGFDLRTLRAIDAAAGAQLDALGRILGLARTSTVDADYRGDLYLQAKINVGRATPEEIITVADYPAGVTKVTLRELWPANILLYLHGAILTRDQRRRLRSTKPAGVGMYIGSSGPDAPFGFGAEKDAAGADLYAEDPDAGGFSELWTLASKDGVSWVINGNASGLIQAGNTVRVVGQAGLDGVYTVNAVAVEAGPTTRLTTTPAPPGGALSTAQLGLETTHLTANGHSRIGSFVELLPST